MRQIPALIRMDPDVYSRFWMVAIIRVLSIFLMAAVFSVTDVFFMTAILPTAAMAGKNTARG
jgi:hypothetical protein